MLKNYLGFLKNKSVEEVKTIDDAIILVKKFIVLNEWDKALKGIKEIKKKEIDSYNSYFKNNKDSEKIRNKKLKDFQKIIKKLDKLIDTIISQKDDYNKKIQEKKEKIKIEKLKQEVLKLIKTKKLKEANNVLLGLFEKYKNYSDVARFYNIQKRKVLNLLEKEKLLQKSKIKMDTQKEARALIGEIITDDEDEKLEKKSFLQKLQSPIKTYMRFLKEVGRKKLMDEVNLMISEGEKVEESLIKTKLANIHKGLIKELNSSDNMFGYEIYGRILGNQKISGDVMGLTENKKNSLFFFGDATGHGVKAGFIVSLLTQKYNQICKKLGLVDAAFEVNNTLKQDLKSGNFITGVFFEVLNNDLGKLNYVGMGHEPMFLFKNSEKTTEKIIPGGLAAGIRKITTKDSIKQKTLELGNNDILLVYSDGITESKNSDGEMYGFDRLKNTFDEICGMTTDLKQVYRYLIESLTNFTSGSKFYDDVSIMLIKRNFNRDVISEKEEIIKMAKKEGVEAKKIRKLKGKTREEISKGLEEIKKEKEMQNILRNLNNLYLTGEIPKLKQECIYFIKKGFIHKKINTYLKKAHENETKYKIEQKNKKVLEKYKVLNELLKKGQYEVVMSECTDIISKDGNI